MIIIYFKEWLYHFYNNKLCIIFYRLDRIEDLADIKDEESEQFDKHMEEINGKKTLLQNEISGLNTGSLF